jgi:hypothetical protein
MRTDTIPAPASNINAPTPIKGEVSPPVAGRLPPAAIAAEAVAVLLAVAVAEGVEVSVGVELAVAEGVDVSVGVELAVEDAIPKDTSGRSLASCAKVAVGVADPSSSDSAEAVEVTVSDSPVAVSVSVWCWRCTSTCTCASAKGEKTNAPTIANAANTSNLLNGASFFGLWCASGRTYALPLPFCFACNHLGEPGSIHRARTPAQSVLYALPLQDRRRAIGPGLCRISYLNFRE